MLKRTSALAAVSAIAMFVMPAASQAGHMLRDGRADCELTKLIERTMERTNRAVRTMIVHERRDHGRLDLGLERLFRDHRR